MHLFRKQRRKEQWLLTEAHYLNSRAGLDRRKATTRLMPATLPINVTVFESYFGISSGCKQDQASSIQANISQSLYHTWVEKVIGTLSSTKPEAQEQVERIYWCFALNHCIPDGVWQWRSETCFLLSLCLLQPPVWLLPSTSFLHVNFHPREVYK